MPTIPGTILATISDEELSALVATEVADCFSPGVKCGYFWEGKPSSYPPSFATDANAVLKLLEKHHPWRADYGGEYGLRMSISIINAQPISYAVGWGPTFARASCFALLKAKGWTVESV